MKPLASMIPTIPAQDDYTMFAGSRYRHAQLVTYFFLLVACLLVVSTQCSALAVLDCSGFSCPSQFNITRQNSITPFGSTATFATVRIANAQEAVALKIDADAILTTSPQFSANATAPQSTPSLWATVPPLVIVVEGVTTSISIEWDVSGASLAASNATTNSSSLAVNDFCSGPQFAVRPVVVIITQVSPGAAITLENALLCGAQSSLTVTWSQSLANVATLSNLTIRSLQAGYNASIAVNGSASAVAVTLHGSIQLSNNATLHITAINGSNSQIAAQCSMLSIAFSSMLVIDRSFLQSLSLLIQAVSISDSSLMSLEDISMVTMDTSNESCISLAVEETTTISRNSSLSFRNVTCHISGILSTGIPAVSMRLSGNTLLADDAALEITTSSISSSGLMTVGINTELSGDTRLFNRSSIRISNNIVVMQDTMSKGLLRINNTVLRGIQCIVSGALACASSSSLLVDRNFVKMAPLFDLSEQDPLQTGVLTAVLFSFGTQVTAWRSRSILSVSWNTLFVSSSLKNTTLSPYCPVQLYGIALTSSQHPLVVRDAALTSISGNDIRFPALLAMRSIASFAIFLQIVSTFLGAAISIFDSSALDISHNAILLSYAGGGQLQFLSHPQEVGIHISATASLSSSPSACVMSATCAAISIGKASAFFIRRNRIGCNCSVISSLYDTLTSLSFTIKSTSDYVGALAVLNASAVVVSDNLFYSVTGNAIEFNIEVQNAPNIFAESGGGAVIVGSSSNFAIQDNVMASDFCVLSPTAWEPVGRLDNRRLRTGILINLDVLAWKWCSGPGAYVSDFTSPILVTTQSVLTFSDNNIRAFRERAIYFDITVRLDNSTYCSSDYFVTRVPKSIAVCRNSSLRLSGNNLLSGYGTSIIVGIGVTLTSAEVWIRNFTRCTSYLIMTPPLDVYIDSNSVFAIDSNVMVLSAVSESFAILLRTTYASMGTVVWISGGSQLSVSSNQIDNGAIMLYFSCFDPTYRFGTCHGRLTATGCSYGPSSESPQYPSASYRPSDVYFAMDTSGRFIIFSNRIVTTLSNVTINFDPKGTVAIRSSSTMEVLGNVIVVRTNVSDSIACMRLPTVEAITSTAAKQFHINGLRCYARSAFTSAFYIVRIHRFTVSAAASIWLACLRLNGNNAKLVVNTTRIDSVLYDSTAGSNYVFGPCVRVSLTDTPSRTAPVIATDSVSASGNGTVTNTHARTPTPRIPTFAVTLSTSPTVSPIRLSMDRTVSPSRRSMSAARTATPTCATATARLTASQRLSVSVSLPSPTLLHSVSDNEPSRSSSVSISITRSHASKSHVPTVTRSASDFNECPFEAGRVIIASTAETIAASSIDGTMAIILPNSNEISISYDSLASAKFAQIDFLLSGVDHWAPYHFLSLNNGSSSKESSVLLQSFPTNQSGVLRMRAKPLSTVDAIQLYQNLTSSNGSLPLSVSSAWPLGSVSSRQSFPATISLSCVSSKGHFYNAKVTFSVAFESSDTFFSALVQTAGRVASTMSLVSVGVGQPSSASRAMTLQQLSSCADNSIDNSIIPLSIGSADSGQGARNTLIGNLMVLALVFAVLSFASGVYFILKRRRLVTSAAGGDTDTYTIRMAMLRLHLPSSGAPAFATTLQASFAASAYLVVQGGGALDTLLGVIGFALWGSYIFALLYLWRVISRTHAPHRIPLPFFPPPDIRRVMGWMMHHNWKWRKIVEAPETSGNADLPQQQQQLEKSGFQLSLSLPNVKARRPTVTEISAHLMKRKEYQSDILAQQYHVFLVDFRLLWYAALDAFLTAAGGLISVFPLLFPTSNVCIVSNGIVCGTYVGQLVVFLVTNPTTNRFGYVNVVASQLLTLLCAVSQMAGQYALDSELENGVSSGGGTSTSTGSGSTASQWKRTASLCKMLLLIVSILRYAVDFTSIAKGSWRLVREVKPKTGEGDSDSGDEYRYAVGDTLNVTATLNRFEEEEMSASLGNSFAVDDGDAIASDSSEAEPPGQLVEEADEVIHERLWTFLASKNDAISLATDEVEEHSSEDETDDGGSALLALGSHRRRSLSFLTDTAPFL